MSVKQLNTAGVLGSCGDSPPHSRSRAEPCWGGGITQFLLLKKTIDWFIIYSFLVEYLVLSDKFLYKFELVK